SIDHNDLQFDAAPVIQQLRDQSFEMLGFVKARDDAKSRDIGDLPPSYIVWSHMFDSSLAGSIALGSNSTILTTVPWSAKFSETSDWRSRLQSCCGFSSSPVRQRAAEARREPLPNHDILELLLSVTISGCVRRLPLLRRTTGVSCPSS